MCIRKEPRELFQPIADLDLEIPETVRDLVFGPDPSRNGSAYVGALTYFGLLESL